VSAFAGYVMLALGIAVAMCGWHLLPAPALIRREAAHGRQEPDETPTRTPVPTDPRRTPHSHTATETRHP
jgi:hypothetical protein